MRIISVHTEDFTDEENVFEVEKMLRQIPVKRSLTYKPDMFSVIGIYRNNKYNLKPVIYSRYKSHHGPAASRFLVSNGSTKGAGCLRGLLKSI